MLEMKTHGECAYNHGFLSNMSIFTHKSIFQLDSIAANKERMETFFGFCFRKVRGDIIVYKLSFPEAACT